MVVQISATWGGAGSNPKTSVFHVPTQEAILPFMTAFRTMVQSRNLGLTTATRFVFNQEYREFDTNSGVMINFGQVTVPAVVTGDGGADGVPDVAQGLLRWQTMAVGRRRRLQGRTYVPNITRLASVGGNNADAPAWTAAAQTMIANSDLYVWSRPIYTPEGGLIEPGNMAKVTACQMWNEWAVQRGRRG